MTLIQLYVNDSCHQLSLRSRKQHAYKGELKTEILDSAAARQGAVEGKKVELAQLKYLLQDLLGSEVRFRGLAAELVQEDRVRRSLKWTGDLYATE